MAKQTTETTGNFIRKETALLIGLVALAVGFFGGVMFGIYKSDSPVPGRPMPATTGQQPSGDGGLTDRIESLKSETQKNPSNLEAWVQLGNEYFDGEQFEKSIQAYKKALELDPNNANVWTDMGVMYRRSKQPQEAIKAFDKAIQVDPKHEVSRWNKGIVLLHDLNDPAGALLAWEDMIRVNPLAMAPNGQSVDQMVQQLKKQMSQQGNTN